MRVEQLRCLQTVTRLNGSEQVGVIAYDFVQVVIDAVPQDDDKWEAFINAWLELHRRDGILQSVIDQWVYGKSFAPSTPRWSVVRNVLGWVH